MKFKTHNTGISHNEVNFTSLQGYIAADYNKLVELFGEPMESDGYKVDAEWLLQFEDGTVATIYNWKDGRNYLGDDGMDVEDIVTWHVGGHEFRAVQLVQDVLDDVITGEYSTYANQLLLA